MTLSSSGSQYSPILSSKSPFAPRNTLNGNILFSKRYSRFLVTLVFLFLLLVFSQFCWQWDTELVPYPESQSKPPNSDLPPIFERYHEYERQLAQHDLSLMASDGTSAKFLYAANHAWGVGWGNVLQEMILNAHLAYSTNRAFVFDNYTWDMHESDYSEFNGKIIPSRIPISAILSGPIIGGTFRSEQEHSLRRIPHAVSREHFYKVCPERTILNTQDVKSNLRDAEGITILQAWVDKINSIEDRCIEISSNSEPAFDIWLFGSPTIHSLWPSLSQSPFLTNFAFSPLVLSAYATNRHLFAGSRTILQMPTLPFTPSWTASISDSAPALDKPLNGLLVLHLRRGDFEDHCHHLAKYRSSFTGFNSFPEFKDHFEVPDPQLERNDENADRAFTDVYQERCFPEIHQIVARVKEIRRGVRERTAHAAEQGFRSRLGFWWTSEDSESRNKLHDLNRIYIMTNGKREWLNELKEALMKDEDGDGGWHSIATSRDLVLNWEQGYVAQALDMYVAARAQVFVGNGFSSLTSNIVMLRKANGVDPEGTRFW